jgi:hypothetical protein
MKQSLMILAVALSTSLASEAVKSPLNEPLSPVLTPQDRRSDETRGIWFPNTYGGVTGVILDLGQVGSDKMLRVRFLDRDELHPLLGTHYRVQSDQTTEDKGRGTRQRTVILVDDESLQKWGRKQILCYKIFTYEDRSTPEGVKLTGEATHYSLTISEIENNYEVLYLIRLGTSFPNAEHPNLTRPPASEPGGGSTPAAD